MSITGFSHTYFVDPHTGKTGSSYRYRGKPCTAVVLTSRKAKQLAGYMLLEKDVRSCLAWIDEIDARNDEGATDQGIKHYVGKDRANYTIIKGLFTALVTFYGKCFSQCEGRRIKLERFKLDPEFYTIHDHLICLRNNFAAHSGAELVETSRIVALYSPFKRGKFKAKLVKELEQPDVLITRPGEKSIRQLLEHVQQIAQAKMEALGKAIETEEVPKIALERLAQGS